MLQFRYSKWLLWVYMCNEHQYRYEKHMRYTAMLRMLFSNRKQYSSARSDGEQHVSPVFGFPFAMETVNNGHIP